MRLSIVLRELSNYRTSPPPTNPNSPLSCFRQRCKGSINECPKSEICSVSADPTSSISTKTRECSKTLRPTPILGPPRPLCLAPRTVTLDRSHSWTAPGRLRPSKWQIVRMPCEWVIAVIDSTELVADSRAEVTLMDATRVDVIAI